MQHGPKFNVQKFVQGALCKNAIPYRDGTVATASSPRPLAVPLPRCIPVETEPVKHARQPGPPSSPHGILPLCL